MYVDNAIDESSLLRLDPNEKLNLDEQGSIFLNSTLTSPKTIIEIRTKIYIDSLHDENERARRDLNDDLDKKTIVRFNQTLQNYLKVSVGKDTYNLTKYDKIQITDTTIIKHPNTGGYLLQKWVIKCNDKNNNAKIKNFIRSTKTSSETANSGAGGSPPRMVLCTLRHHLLIMVITFGVLGKELILYKLLI